MKTALTKKDIRELVAGGNVRINQDGTVNKWDLRCWSKVKLARAEGK
jgi:hypothetical protein